MALYNVYCFFSRKDYAHYSIGELKENSNAYQNVSLRYKVKLLLYGVTSLITFLSFLINLNPDMLRSLTKKNYIRRYIKNIIGAD